MSEEQALRSKLVESIVLKLIEWRRDLPLEQMPKHAVKRDAGRRFAEIQFCR